MTQRFFTWDERGALQPWDLSDASPTGWPDCRYWARVLRHAQDLLGDATWQWVLTRNVEGTPPIVGPDVVVILWNDEVGLEPAYARQVGLVVKTMGGARRPFSVRLRSWDDLRYAPLTIALELVVQLRRAPNKARAVRRRGLRSPALLDVPLGTHLLEDVPQIPFEQRPIDVAFAGSLGNSEREAARRLPSQKVRARRAVFAALDQVAKQLPEIELRTNRLLSFHWAHDHSETYSELLASTKVALCPRGSWWETYRFWEAMASGCVVVAERLPDRPYYRGSPAVTVDGWRRLPDLLRDLFADPEALRARAEASYQFWLDHGAPPAVAESIAARLR